MLKYCATLCMVIFGSILNAADMAGDDDVLFLSQIHSTGICCVSPLAQQKDGSASGPVAEWKKANYYLRQGKEFLKIEPSLFECKMEWDLMLGGTVSLPFSKTTWEYLQVIPNLDEPMRTAIGMTKNEALFFKLKLAIAPCGSYIISPGAVMVRMLDRKVTCKKRMTFEALGISTLDGMPKMVLKITKA